ncbi:hypothetical protein [Enterocloster clostridioformis]|jgi:ABC-type glycerol-3-phosphate transport system substrate-binding protein|nr:hypothetical protein [Enterocloster clostridioformis]MCA5580265.1 hypothetical protein [Enterocloster clostridioformis]MDB2128555.1 hypothetical protein [Enterocloster clostridioformis]MDU1961336.1 hypothetical protein [Enterocloster clostridioformis]
MMEVSPYDSNTENTAYFAAQTGYIPVRKSARQDPVFAAVLAEKPQANGEKAMEEARNN